MANTNNRNPVVHSGGVVNPPPPEGLRPIIPPRSGKAAPASAMSDEIEGLRAHVALLKSALAQAERENDELRAEQLSSVGGWRDTEHIEAQPLYLHPPPQPKRTVTYVCPVCAASLERQE